MASYAIGIGGSGARCIESLIHHCAAGMGPKKLFVLLIDPDEANGNLNRVKQVITRYQSCREQLQQPGENQLFGTELVFSVANGQPLLVWSPTMNEPTLGDFLRYDLQPQELKDMTALLYTRGELRMNLELGFRGHSSVGAPVMARMQKVLDEKPWSDIVTGLQQDVGKGDPATLFVYASIFGATGASGFPTVGRILRHTTKEWPNGDKVKLGGCLMLPYFGFNRGEQDSELAARADHFLINSKAALNHYNFEWKVDAHNPYDSLYLLGESSPDTDARQFALGGQTQTNPAHYVEILSAQAALHFFTEHGKAQADLPAATERRKYFAARGQEMVVRWDDFPGQRWFRDKLLKFASTTAAFLGFYYPLVNDPEFEKKRKFNPWYAKRFRPNELTSGGEPAKQRLLREYSLLLMQWAWETHAFAGGRELRVLNRAAIERARAGGFEAWRYEDFASLLFPSGQRPRPGDWNSVQDRMNACEPADIASSTGKFLDMLYKSVSAFCDQNYALR